MESEQKVMGLLRSLDVMPCTSDLEAPEGYDHQVAEECASRLQVELAKEFGVPWDMNAGVQDASYGIELSVHAFDPPLAIRLSNYGKLAAATTPALGSHRDLGHAASEGVITVEQRRLVEKVLDELGYTLIPLPFLRRRYDGVTRLAEFNGSEHATWWHRYFEHI
ncbi:hypothetical protein [Streptomyces sp. NPDC094032]|uniref:hypothetical protein n=1 Tax=Streptomyces sp. NPDC094032 TaxID=3155308 RepID=UPI00331D5BFA